MLPNGLLTFALNITESVDEHNRLRIALEKAEEVAAHFEAGTGKYPVVDGVLVCEGGNLVTKKDYADFIFDFEFQLPKGGNNGLGIRAPLEGDAAYVGMELQILDDQHARYKGKIKSEQHHGSIYDVFPARTGYLKPAGEWNRLEVACLTNRIEVVLNGEPVTRADLDPHYDRVEQMLAARHNIRSIPTLALFVNGREVARQAGAFRSAQDIAGWVRSHL